MRTPVRSFRPSLLALTLVVGSVAGVGLAGRQAQAPPPVQPDRQMPPVTFRVEINYVEVDAIVVDRQGEFVGDLKADDFQVFEDGKAQKVSNFGLVQIPVERAEAPLFVRQPIEPDVQSNVQPFNGRVYLLVLDELHTDALHTPWVRTAAKKFIQTAIGDNDVAAVVSTQGSANQDFTGNKRLLMAAVDRFMGKSLQSATLNKIDNYNMLRNRPSGVGTDTPRDTDDLQRTFNASATLRTLEQLSDFMAGVRGRRKALVLFSEGIDYDITDPINNQGASQVMQESSDAIAAATRANVSIYSVDPRGLSALAGMGADTMGPPADADPNLKLNAQGMQDEFRLQQDSLRVLADQTGGFASLNSNDFAAAFDRIQKDNSSYYVLGYYPSNDRRDGRFRKIEVKLNRPGLEVRARRGYVAPRGRPPATKAVEAKEGTPPVLAELLSSPLPIPGLRLTAFAAPFRGAANAASIALVVQADGRDFSFKEKDGKLDDTLELSVVAVDEQAGKVKGGVRNTLVMPLKPETQARLAKTGLRLTARFDLPPGRYQLRIGALEVNGGRAGSVHYDLEVPDFSAAPLTMSGVVLTSTLAGTTVSANADAEFARVLPGPPTVSREFSSREEIALIAEIYDNQGRTPHKVDIKTSLRSDDGRELFKQEDERSSTELGGGRGGYGYTARVPLKGLSPGLYVLRVEARSRLGRDVSVSRDVQIRVTG
jgi:VWFA-related protein